MDDELLSARRKINIVEADVDASEPGSQQHRRYDRDQEHVGRSLFAHVETGVALLKTLASVLQAFEPGRRTDMA
jgi:hypothetical protein